jgi:hypothetical protein
LIYGFTDTTAAVKFAIGIQLAAGPIWKLAEIKYPKTKRVKGTDHQCHADKVQDNSRLDHINNSEKSTAEN